MNDKGKASIALVCGIVSILFGLYVPLISWASGAIAIALATQVREKEKGLSLSGMILGILGILIGFAYFLTLSGF